MNTVMEEKVKHFVCFLNMCIFIIVPSSHMYVIAKYDLVIHNGFLHHATNQILQSASTSMQPHQCYTKSC